MFIIIIILDFTCRFEKAADVKESNIKRENKLYSYQEQMAEIELRKVKALAIC